MSKKNVAQFENANEKIEETADAVKLSEDELDEVVGGSLRVTQVGGPTQINIGALANLWTTGD